MITITILDDSDVLILIEECIKFKFDEYGIVYTAGVDGEWNELDIDCSEGYSLFVESTSDLWKFILDEDLDWILSD